MRTAVALCALIGAVLVVPTRAEDAKSAFITTSDGLKIHYLELGTRGSPVILIHGDTELNGAQIVVVPGETHGSVHLNPVYTSTPVKFIDAHSK